MLERSNQSLESRQHSAAARGFGQLFGLHPIPTVLTLAVNAMLFGGELATFGALVPLGFLVAIVLGIITYKAQKRLYADDDETALVKAMAVALLTAIPTGLPSCLTVPAGLVGFVHTIRKR